MRCDAILLAASDEIAGLSYIVPNSAKANAIRETLRSDENILELDVSRYFLSGHPAIRIIETSSEPGLKAMTYNVLLNGKWYKVTYLVSQPEDFPIYLQTAQSMIDSFQIISRR